LYGPLVEIGVDKNTTVTGAKYARLGWTGTHNDSTNLAPARLFALHRCGARPSPDTLRS